MEKEFRGRIYWLTFFFSILVIWLHSFNGELFLGATETGVWVDRVERAVGSLGQIAVPGFFMVSSYLFYRGFTWKKLIPKWRTRVNSLLIPYLLWNLLYYIGYVAATRLPGVSHVIGKTPAPFNLEQAAAAVVRYSYNPVFWYLYQLILLVALAPVIYVLCKNTWVGGVSILTVMFALWKNWDFPFLNMDAFFYTCTAAYISLHRDGWGRAAEHSGEGRNRWLLPLALLLASGSLAFLGQPGRCLYKTALFTVLFRLLGVCAVWVVSGYIKFPRTREWMKHSFFLYAIHFAWVRLFNKAGAFILPARPASALLMFFLMPVFMVALSHWIGKGLAQVAPKVFRVLSGGR